MADPREPSYPAKNVRVAIENVSPEIDRGRYAIKRAVNERVVVEADIFADGHDVLSAALKFRPEKNPAWSETPMEFPVNDRGRGEFSVGEIGTCLYTIEAWVDHFKSWRRNLKKKLDANQDASVDLLVGANLIEAAAGRTGAADAKPSPFNARLTALTSRNIPNGFSPGPMAPSDTRKIRPKNMRTLSRSISSATIGAACGAN